MRMRGFTLMEVLIAIGIVIVLTTLVGFSFSAYRKSSDVTAVTDSLLSYLKEARADTLSSKSDSSWGVHIETSRIVIFKGASFTNGAPGNRQTTLPNTTQISSISLTGGGSDVLFKRLTGETDQNGTIVIQSVADSSVTSIVTIQPTGTASS